MNKLVYAQPENSDAEDLSADIFEQTGDQQESPSVRSRLLAAAFELGSGIPEGITHSTSSVDVGRSLTTEMFFDFLAIRLDSSRVEDLEFVANVHHADTGEKLVVELSNATLTTRPGSSRRAEQQSRGMLPA